MKLFLYTACISLSLLTTHSYAMQNQMPTIDKTTYYYSNNSVITSSTTTNTACNSKNFTCSSEWTCSDEQKKIIKTCVFITCGAAVLVAGIWGYKKIKHLFDNDSYIIGSTKD